MRTFPRRQIRTRQKAGTALTNIIARIRWGKDMANVTWARESVHSCKGLEGGSSTVESSKSVSLRLAGVRGPKSISGIVTGMPEETAALAVGLLRQRSQYALRAMWH